MHKKETVLTEKQMEVLKLRKDGLSQVEISRKFGTSVANISATERTALTNITKAKNTLELLKNFDASFWVTISPDTDLYDVVRKVYQKADEKGLWIMHSFPSMAVLISEGAGDRIRGRRILSSMEVGVLDDGTVVVM